MRLRISFLSLVAVLFWISSPLVLAQEDDTIDQEVSEVEDSTPPPPAKKEIKKEAAKDAKQEMEWKEAVDSLDGEVSAASDDFETKPTQPEVKPKVLEKPVARKPIVTNKIESPKKAEVKSSLSPEDQLNAKAEVNNGAPTPGTVSPNPREIFNNPDGGEKVIKVHHPAAAKGLIRINKDKSYQYRIPVANKSKAMSFAFSYVSSPTITSSPASNVSIDYKTMYGGGNIYGILMNYEWMPFRKYGSLGVLLEGGLSYAHGSGTLVSGGSTYPAQETYTLFVVPMSAFLKYRLEYWKGQWFVPYVEAGGTYYGLGELRSGDNKFRYAGSPAVGGGGGVHLNLSKFDPKGSFGLAREYGVADLWLNLEMRAMAGLKKDIDFTNSTINFGIVADY